jgi:hypothetical protein
VSVRGVQSVIVANLRYTRDRGFDNKILAFFEGKRRSCCCSNEAVKYAFRHSPIQQVTTMFLQEVQKLGEDMVLGFLDTVQGLAEFVRWLRWSDRPWRLNVLTAVGVAALEVVDTRKTATFAFDGTLLLAGRERLIKLAVDQEVA